MLYILAFVIGGCARSASKASIFALVYVALYAAFLFAVSVQTLRSGATSVGYVLQYLAIYGVIALAVTALGYLCRILVGEPLARSADGGITSTFD